MTHGETNYSSGDDYVLEYHRFRFAFGSRDFEERVTAAAVRLGLVESNDLDPDEIAGPRRALRRRPHCRGTERAR